MMTVMHLKMNITQIKS